MHIWKKGESNFNQICSWWEVTLCKIFLRHDINPFSIFRADIIRRYNLATIIKSRNFSPIFSLFFFSFFTSPVQFNALEKFETFENAINLPRALTSRFSRELSIKFHLVHHVGIDPLYPIFFCYTLVCIHSKIVTSRSC